MGDLDGLINSKISLISQDDVKFTGTLFSINTQESSMVLKDVQCLGTEDRVTDPAKITPANPAILPFVTFPGHDIKDLIVHDSAAPVPEPAPSAPLPTPPAQQPQQRTQRENKQNKEAKAKPPKPPVHAADATAAQQQQQQQQTAKPAHQNATKKHQNNSNSASGAGNSGTSGAAGTGAHLLHLKERKAGENPAPAEAVGEFDFAAGLSIFKKEDVLANVATNDTGAPKYKKDDFFDSLGGDEQEGGGRKSRMTASEERALNQDTFGAVALQNNYRRGYGGRGGRGSGGRGRGRGGRGRGRGRGSSAPVAAN